jgi:DNA-binding CsgD family transcriptional regulator
MKDMGISVKEGVSTLTEKEKQTLRLMVRGHDAKSIARDLGLSVHTIHERLRDARRKMAVSSSREAARLLLDVEGDSLPSPTPHLLGDSEIGADACDPPRAERGAPTGGAGRADRRRLMLIGVLLMTLVLGLLAIATLSQGASAPHASPAAAETPANAELVQFARKFLALLDQRRWEESYGLTGAAFRKLNTAQVWASVSEQVRAPLGAATSRTFMSQLDLPAPPYGYTVIKFRTDFASKAEAIETVTLEREAGGWQVVGVTIE